MGRLLRALWQQGRQLLGLDREVPVERPPEPSAPQDLAPPPTEARPPSSIPREYRRTPNPTYGSAHPGQHSGEGRRRA